ncbi:MAG: YceI family protein [Gammaproteobacteria bacterium]|nr:YceI family protein [Gammaproteobacteria bacterium]
MKLMRTVPACLLLATALLGALLLAGCPRPERPAAAASARPVAARPQRGTPYDVVAAESLLTVRVYRAGTLASAGHNHLLATHALAGTLYVPEEPLQSSCRVHFPLASLTVDEAALRAADRSGDFTAAVPDAAREGTRAHALGPDQLDAAHYPEIELRCLELRPDPAAGPDALQARLEVDLRGATYPLSLPLHYRLADAELTVQGETQLLQSALGIRPYSALLGALQVQDAVRVQLQLHARRGTP